MICKETGCSCDPDDVLEKLSPSKFVLWSVFFEKYNELQAKAARGE